MRMCIHPRESGVIRIAATHLAHKLTEEQELRLEHLTQSGCPVRIKGGEVYTYSGVVALALQEKRKLGGVIVAAPTVNNAVVPALTRDFDVTVDVGIDISDDSVSLIMGLQREGCLY